eukprot:166041_1
MWYAGYYVRIQVAGVSWSRLLQSLYNDATCRNRSHQSYPFEVYQSIDDYINSFGDPSPNTNQKRKILNQETNQKEDHPKHYMDGDFKAMYADYIKQHEDLFRALNLKKKPCKSMFEERRRVRHKYL